MSELIKRSLYILGTLCLAAGLYQAVDIWLDLPEIACTSKTPECSIERLQQAMARVDEAKRILLEKDIEASKALQLAKQERELAEAMAPALKEAAIYWAVSGIVSCLFLWGFAAIIGELIKIRNRASGADGAGPH